MTSENGNLLNYGLIHSLVTTVYTCKYIYIYVYIYAVHLYKAMYNDM